MTVIEEVHAGHDATFVERGGRRVVDHYGRPERSHAAVRRVVGVVEHGFGVLAVEGDDRVEFVDNAVSNRVPREDGQGCYALLVFLPPSEAGGVAEDWREKTFIQDVTVDEVTDDFGVFGVYGPNSTEKIASVLTGPGSPEDRLSFVRGSMGDAGVTVARDDDLTGEEGYLVVCAASEAADVFDTLENRGQAAAPFGYRTWETLTLEAGTPLFASELDGRIPNNLGIRNALDFEKGCYVGQEVVSRIENRGRTPERLVGLRVEAVPESGAAVFADDAAVGEVTRAAESPTREEPLALASVDADVATRSDASDGAGDDDGDDPALTVRVDGEERDATLASLPFVEGSGRSARLPEYPGG